MTPLTRREFLQSSAAALGAFSVLSHSSATEGSSLVNTPIPVIDTHQHLWDLDRFTLPWMQGPAKEVLGKNFLLPEYRSATSEVPIAQTVYMEVNVAAEQQTAEAEYVFDLCRRDDNQMTGAVIGGSPQSAEFKNYVEQFAGNEYFKGVRTVLHDPDRKAGTCLKPQFIENMKLLGKHDKSYDLCMRPAEVSDAAELAAKCPDTRFILDHCGNMPVTELNTKLHDQWKAGLKQMASVPNTVCKISGIVVTAKESVWKPADLAPVVNECMDTFGEDRIFFGGDWPVCTLKASYQQWYSALQEITKDRSESFKRKLFYENAQKFYRLPKVEV
ncbi:MAG: amidohydrolase family protein [Planctomycetaceae bacterium]|nr:amidohydrolase family protein [Planctomycetaceae bacterium]